MKTFDIIEQTPFNLTPKSPHRNLVRQIIDQMGIEVKSKKVRGKDSRCIEELPSSLNPESIRAASVLLCDVSKHQYTGKVERGLEYHPSILNVSGGVPVSNVDATGDWAHLASLVELIKGIPQRWINHMPFYLRGLVRMVPMNQLHHILLYAALADLKTNMQIGIDASLQYHDDLHEHLDTGGNPIGFHKDGQFYNSCPFVTALLSYAEVVESRHLPRKMSQYTRVKRQIISACHWPDIQSHVQRLMCIQLLIKSYLYESRFKRLSNLV